MSFYNKHVFICCNQRAAGEGCCNNLGGSIMLNYLKERIKTLGLAGAGHIRVNLAGCLGRCDNGPVIVIYPEAVWYTFIDQEDIDEILHQHLIGNQIVERLQITHV